MSKRHRRTKLHTADYISDYQDFYPDGDMYQAPRGKKPRGKDKRRAGIHKMAYYD
ncbi:MAG: hypothetical protein HKN36_01125 [Hellea sp.]|nr:hypothetical protein [Hellea sp.]